MKIITYKLKKMKAIYLARANENALLIAKKIIDQSKQEGSEIDIYDLLAMEKMEKLGNINQWKIPKSQTKSGQDEYFLL